jgi:hypothetical protein
MEVLFLLLALLLPQQHNIQHNPHVAAGGSSPVDWTSSFVAVWLCEETSGTRANESSTSCGSDCDLTDNNTVASGTGIQGSNSCDFEETDSDNLSCTMNNPGCNEIEAALESGAVSIVSWLNAESNVSSNARYVEVLGGSPGFETFTLQKSEFSTPQHELTAFMEGQATSVDSGEAETVGTYEHLAFTWANDADDDIEYYVNGESVGTAGSLTSTPTVGSNGSFTLGGRNSSVDVDGDMDEIGIIDAELTAAQICRICSCGIDGSECVCSGSSYSDSGRNSSNCGSCTLPDCDAAAP